MEKCYQCGTQCRRGYLYKDALICEECLNEYFEDNYDSIKAEIEKNSPQYQQWFYDDIDLIFVEWFSNYLTLVVYSKEV